MNAAELEKELAKPDQLGNESWLNSLTPRKKADAGAELAIGFDISDVSIQNCREEDWLKYSRLN